MKDFFGGFTGLVKLVEAYLFPAVATIGLWWFLVKPRVRSDGLFAEIDRLSGSEATAAFAGAALLLALLLRPLSSWAYAVLEGYKLPPMLKDWWILSSKDRLLRLLDKHNGASTPREKSSALAELKGYPRRSSWIMATRLGNTLKAGETYGTYTYGLDTVALWSELMAVAPERLTSDLGAARTGLDAFVSFIVCSCLFWASVLGLLVFDEVEPAALALASLLTAPAVLIFYRAANRAAAWYSALMIGLVNVSRLPLAKALGLALPTTHAEERKLWRAISNSTYLGRLSSKEPEWRAVIEEARRTFDSRSPSDGAESQTNDAPS